MMPVDAPARQSARAMQTSVSSRSNSGGVVLIGLLALRPPTGKDINGVRFHIPRFSDRFVHFLVPEDAQPAQPGLRPRINRYDSMGF